jgi:hypothetical protein
VVGSGYLVKYSRIIYEGTFKNKDFEGVITYYNGDVFTGISKDEGKIMEGVME